MKGKFIDSLRARIAIKSVTLQASSTLVYIDPDHRTAHLSASQLESWSS